jgi:hypothetical protein
VDVAVWLARGTSLAVACRVLFTRAVAIVLGLATVACGESRSLEQGLTGVPQNRLDPGFYAADRNHAYVLFAFVSDGDHTKAYAAGGLSNCGQAYSDAPFPDFGFTGAYAETLSDYRHPALCDGWKPSRFDVEYHRVDLDVIELALTPNHLPRGSRPVLDRFRARLIPAAEFEGRFRELFASRSKLNQPRFEPRHHAFCNNLLAMNCDELR